MLIDNFKSQLLIQITLPHSSNLRSILPYKIREIHDLVSIRVVNFSNRHKNPNYEQENNYPNQRVNKNLIHT